MHLFVVFYGLVEELLPLFKLISELSAALCHEFLCSAFKSGHLGSINFPDYAHLVYYLDIAIHFASPSVDVVIGDVHHALVQVFSRNVKLFELLVAVHVLLMLNPIGEIEWALYCGIGVISSVLMRLVGP